MKDSIVVVQALLLGLGALLLTPFGATLVATIGGLLTATYTSQLAFFTIVFAVIYGLLVDGFIKLFRARSNEIEIRAHRFALAITVSTAIIGFIAYGTTILLGLLPANPEADVFILAGGIVTGLIGGYLDVVIWRRAARYFV
jgi:LytS/YehU family sensor histidine kinase